MGHALAFDTHVYVKKLIAVGVDESQAEVQAETLTQLLDNDLATKRDLKELEIALKRDIKELESATRRDIKELESATRHDIKELEMRLTIRLGAIMAGGIAIVATLVKLL